MKPVRMKKKNVLRLWVGFTILLTVICITSVFSMVKQVTFPDVAECKVESEMSGLPMVNIVEVEKEIIVEKPVDVYNFPFEVEEKGTYKVKGICDDCIPKKEYSKLRGKEEVTVFASSNVMPEGTLLWIEGVGIRQVQTVYSDFDGIYIFFGSHSKAESFGEKEALVFKVLE